MDAFQSFIAQINCYHPVYDKPINDSMKKVVKTFLEEKKLPVDTTSTFKHVVSFLDNQEKHLTANVIVDWFITTEYAYALKTKKISALQFAQELVKNEFKISFAIEQLAGIKIDRSYT